MQVESVLLAYKLLFGAPPVWRKNDGWCPPSLGLSLAVISLAVLELLDELDPQGEHHPFRPDQSQEKIETLATALTRANDEITLLKRDNGRLRTLAMSRIEENEK